MKNKNLKLVILLMLIISPIGKDYSQSGWVQQNSGTSLNLEAVSFLDANYGIITGENGRMLKTTNGGLNWIILSNVTNETIVDIKILNQDKVIGMFFEYPSTLRIIRTTNAGNSWNITKLDSIARTYAPGSMYFYNTDLGVISYNNKIRYTTNGGVNWNISSVTVSGLEFFFNDIQMVTPSIGYALGHYKISSNNNRAEIYKTTNGCETWNYTSISFDHSDNSYETRFGFSFIDSQNAWVCGMTRQGSIGTESYNVKTENGFTNNSVFPLISQRFFHDCFFVNYNTGWFIGERYVYKTSNSGLSFVSQMQNDERMNDIQFINENTGWIVADSGKIFKTTNGGEPIGIEIISNETPVKYRLSQNYPNPFNPSTKFQIDIKESGNVRLNIYDILGNEIAILIAQEMKPGTYNVDWNALNNPSGIYFYKIETKNFSETKKMVLLK